MQFEVRGSHATRQSFIHLLQLLEKSLMEFIVFGVVFLPKPMRTKFQLDTCTSSKRKLHEPLFSAACSTLDMQVREKHKAGTAAFAFTSRHSIEALPTTRLARLSVETSTVLLFRMWLRDNSP